MIKDYLNFEVVKGAYPIKLTHLRELIQHFPYGSKYRIYFLLLAVSGARPSGIQYLKWSNFSKDYLIYKPNKQQGVTRIIKIPPLVLEELEHYKKSNYFENLNVFNFKYKNLERRFNDKVRPKLSKAFQEMAPFRYSKLVQYKHLYTVRSIRTSIATVIFSYYDKVYPSVVALARTCVWMGHKSDKITADHYIKNIHKLDLDKFPDMTFLDLMDFVIYNKSQDKLTKYIEVEERQTLLLES